MANRNEVGRTDTYELPNLRVWRRSMLMTQQELFDKSGVSVQTINRLERGKHPASIATLNRIAAAFGVPTRQLFDLPKFQPK